MSTDHAYKTMPHSIEAELGLLGSILLDSTVFPGVRPMVSISSFFRDAHQIVYRSICDVYDRLGMVDFITLEDELQKDGKFERVGGIDGLMAISNGAPHSLHAKYYAEIVRQHFGRRETIRLCMEAVDKSYNMDDTSEAVLQDLVIQANTLMTSGTDTAAKPFAQSLQAVREMMGRRMATGEVEGISTGFLSLDKMIGGYAKGRLVVVAGRPGMGKTAFAMGTAITQAHNYSRVLFISREMGDIELAIRAIASESRVNARAIQETLDINDHQLRRIEEAIEHLSAAKLSVDDETCYTLAHVESLARKMKNSNQLDALYIDYIQLLEGEKGSRGSRQEAVATISRGLKNLAKSLQIPVVGLSQLNRLVEGREDKRPRMADLRESGAIEQDADQVLLLHRPSYYDPNDKPGMCEIIVAKNRHGPSGTVDLPFHGPTLTFGEFSHDEEDF